MDEDDEHGRGKVELSDTPSRSMSREEKEPEPDERNDDGGVKTRMRRLSEACRLTWGEGTDIGEVLGRGLRKRI